MKKNLAKKLLKTRNKILSQIYTEAARILEEGAVKGCCEAIHHAHVYTILSGFSDGLNFKANHLFAKYYYPSTKKEIETRAGGYWMNELGEIEDDEQSRDRRITAMLFMAEIAKDL